MAKKREGGGGKREKKGKEIERVRGRRKGKRGEERKK